MLRGLNLDAHGVLMLLFILACYAVAGSLDYADAQRAEAMRQEARADLHRDALLACMNGGAPGHYTIDANGDRRYIVCGEPFEVTDQNAKGPRT